MTPEDQFLAQQRLLVIAPHADDESFGCAGTMARIKSLGGEVYVTVCSVGDLKHYDGTDHIVSGEAREAELAQVMSFLEVDDWDILYREPERHLRLDAIPRRDLIARIEREGKLAIDRIRPTMLAIPVSSYNQDHEAVFRAAFTAARPGVRSLKPFQTIVIGYDNTSLFWSLEREKFHPNFYIDISAFLDKKLAALSMHRSQMRDALHHSSVQNVEFIARVRGREISVEAAEGYMVFRHVL
ncbi:MAG TPA: PIG-L family deacetylase [Candidatus Hydrogenedentes bacterium]|nr:PIG-L family deacetylase [Candidatus Hydrogenedentota bacterium]HPG69957.1 PIG-L family deacetylase [Candidatus Hydrogenedentota bacterium]